MIIILNSIRILSDTALSSSSSFIYLFLFPFLLGLMKLHMLSNTLKLKSYHIVLFQIFRTAGVLDRLMKSIDQTSCIYVFPVQYNSITL